MNARENATLLIKKLKEINEEDDRLNEERQATMEKIGQYHKVMILEENLLSTIKWRPDVSWRRRFHADRKSKETALGLAEELHHSSGSWYHWKFEVEPGIELAFNDNDVSLIVDDNANLLEVIKKYNLNIDTSNIEKEIAKIEATLKSLNAIKESVRNP